MNTSKWIRIQWDRILSVACVLAGIAMLIVGWLGVSRTGYPADQLPYILSAGIGGLFVLGLGSTLWLSADMRDEWHKLDRIEGALEGLQNHPAVVRGLSSSEPAQLGMSERPISDGLEPGLGGDSHSRDS